MLLRPSNRAELCSALALASSRKERLETWDLSALAALVDHQPADMTATVEAGCTLARLQAALAPARQWLPLDPAHPEQITIGHLLAWNLNGPRRLGCGTIRDYLIGITVALPTGQLIKAGGKVVKNVAGYDLCKLFVGARDTLGIIVEATFKLRPMPETEQIFAAQFDGFRELEKACQRLDSLRCDPVVLDAYRFAPEGPINLAIAFAGAQEDVAGQVTRAVTVVPLAPSSLEYDAAFRNRPGAVTTGSVLPSQAVGVLEKSGAAEFLARLGNGSLHLRGGSAPPPPRPPQFLMDRLKAAYDPAGILPAYAA